jgi:uncharacterized glyoxalase superfamily protein PhnB
MAIRTLVPLLNVADVEDSMAFYCEMLGFEVIDQAEADGVAIWAHLAAGESSLMLNRPDEIDSEPRMERPSYSDVVLYLMVDDAPALYLELESRGVALGPLERQDYGLHEFQLRDPDGYEVAVGSPVED